MKKSICLQNIKIEAADDSEILGMISLEDMAKIKAVDPHPFFQLYSFVHEGLARPHVVGEKKPPIIEWTRAAVQSVKNVILKGRDFFKNHKNKDGTQERKLIGKIIANQEKEIDGNLHHVIVTYHTPEMRAEAEKCDSCSQEADWDFIPVAGKWIAEKINKFKAVAGLNSNEDRPAFSGAKRLAAIEAAYISVKDDPGEGITPGEGKGEIVDKDLKDFNYKDICKHIVEERNGRPHDIFSEEDLKNDNVFKGIFDTLEKNEAQIKLITEENETLKKNIEETGKKELIATAKTRAGELLKTLKIDNEIIKTQVMDYAEKNPDRDDESFKAEATKLTELEQKIKQSMVDKTKIPEGTGTEDGKDLSDPKNNPFLM